MLWLPDAPSAAYLGGHWLPDTASSREDVAGSVAAAASAARRHATEHLPPDSPALELLGGPLPVCNAMQRETASALYGRTERADCSEDQREETR